MMIVFNKPHLSGKEMQYINQAVSNGHISGNGPFTKKCHRYFEENYGFQKCLLTTSCTDALEMAALLLDLQEGDEIIMPSFTFVSTANAFVLRGAKIVFTDSRVDHPGMDENQIERLITDRTKAIVPVHYSGVACDMDKIMEIASKYNLLVVEDAAQAINSFYKGRPLGSIGHLAAFSFHETKNISSGEGGMLVVNDNVFNKRAEIIWEKGTNRVEFFNKEVNKYGWVDVGSSFLPSDIIAAYLYAQLENIEHIQKRRKEIWNLYYENLAPLAHENFLKLPVVPEYSTNNFHLFYIVSKSITEREQLIIFLKKNNVSSVFHYQPLHQSRYFKSKYTGESLNNCDCYGDRLLRLPFYFDLSNESVDYITHLIKQFYSV
jgi:dTDP-4-amino-4,6-dideoxygalactose transaminase